jgi:hypothetical protein
MPFGLEIDEQHLAHDRRHWREERRLDPWRQGAGYQCQLFGDGLSSARDILSPVEFDPDHHDTDCGRRADAPYADRSVQR